MTIPGREMLATPIAALGARLGTLLVAYVVLERWLFGIARLPAASYEQPLLVAEIARWFLVGPRLAPSYALSLGLLLVLAYVIGSRFARLWVRWRDLDDGPVLRIVVSVPTVVVAWVFATYDYNLYFGQAHLADRLILLGLAGLTLHRPVFALPFAAIALALIWQFTHPIGPYSAAQPFALLRVLLLFSAFLLLRAVGTRHRADDFVFLVFTLVAASYLVAGIGKLRLGWITSGHVALLLPATYANGWLGFLEPATIGALTRRLLALDWVLVLGTLVAECGALLCLVRRRAFVLMLLLWIGFHVGVLGLSGIFFWQWMLFEAALVLVLLKNAHAPVLGVFSRPHVALSIPLIIGGTWWFDPVDLSWYNSGVSYTYRFVGEGESGRRYALPPSFFSPYDYQFTLGSFGYLSQRPQLQVAWGSTQNRGVAESTQRARDPAEVSALEESMGRVFGDGDRARELDDFVARFVGAFNERRSKRTVLSPLAAPDQLWTFDPPDAFRGEERLARVVVRQVTSFFDGGRYIEMDAREVRSVAVPVSEAAP